jgi:type I restriction enzyme, S subunit
MTMSLVVEHFDDLFATPEDLERLNNAILQLAIRGKLVGQDANDEPANKLLEKIREAKGRESEVSGIKESEKPYELPDGWEWTRFENIADIATNSVQPDDFQNLPHVAPNNIEKGTGRLLGYKTVEEDDVRSINHHFFPGQLLYSKIRPNLSKAVIVDFEGLCSADMYPLDVSINPQYLLRYILSDVFLEMVTKNDTRVAMPKVNQNELNKILVAVPPLAEQQRIVARVEELFARTSALAKELANSQIELDGLNRSALSHLLASETPEEFNQHWEFIAEHFDLLFQGPEHLAPLRQSILELAVRGKLTYREDGDEPAKELLKRIQEEKKKLIDGGKLKKEKLPQPNKEIEKPFELPKGWEWAKLIEISQLITDGTHVTPNYVSSGIPFISVNNMIGNKISFGSAKFITEDEHAFFTKRCKPEKGDILFGKVGSIGVCDVVEVDHEFSIFVQIALLKIFQNEINSYYLKYAIMSSSIQNQVNRMASGTALRYIGINKINLILCPIPPLAEQERIVKRVEQLLSLCDALEASLQSAEEERGRLVESVLAKVGN